jgi:hypothetical protein
MQIFLDDEREPVNSLDWYVVRSYSEFIDCVLTNHEEPLEYISFDHDLGCDSLSGYDCVKWLCDLDMARRGTVLGPEFKWYVHSQNPVGTKNINEYLSGYLEYKFGGS